MKEWVIFQLIKVQRVRDKQKTDECCSGCRKSGEKFSP